MAKCFLIAGLVGVGLTMGLVAAPAGLAVMPAKSTAAPVKPAVAKPTASVLKPVVVADKPIPEAEGSAGGVGLTVKAGTLGAGLEATVGVNDFLGFRFGVNMMNFGPSIDQDEGTINTDLDWLSYGPLVDWHMFGGGFRVTGGGLINKNKFNLKADLTESVTLDGREYSLSDLSGEVTFNELAPYVGFGYGNAVGADGRWHFSCDFGVMIQGEPQVTATATASDPALQPYVDQALAVEVADIQDQASAFQFYPVISVGVSYGF